MNPDGRPRTLSPERVEWVPSSPDAIEVLVYGTWHGPTVPPPAELVVGGSRFAARPAPPGDDVPPAWSAAFLVPLEVRSAVESGGASLDVGGLVVELPPALPGRLVVPAATTVIDPAVLAERRARRAEIAEQSAAERAASAEQAAETLRAQLENLEERVARAADERDALASRVADAERRLRLAEQREEAERRRRGELEEELVAERRAVEHEFRELSDRLASAEEVTEALERELDSARRREGAERLAREAVDEQLREALERIEALEGAAGDDGEELRRQAAVLSARLAEAEAERARLEGLSAEREHDQLDALRRSLEQAAATGDEVAALRQRLADAEQAVAEVTTLRRELGEASRARDEVAMLRHQLSESSTTIAALRRQLADAEGEELVALRAEIAELQRRLAETLNAVEDERAAHEAAEQARRRAAERTQEERAARQAAERRLQEGFVSSGAASDREEALANQVAALEDEIAARAETHQRVQLAIDAVRSELERVRARVGDGRDSAQAEALVERVRLLEGLVRERDDELERTRAALAEAQASAAAAERAADELRARGSTTEATLRAEFEERVRDLSGAVADMRRRLVETTSDFEHRLAAERTRREAAEAALAALRASSPADVAPEPAPAPDDALDALITGLREQVDTAREQLEEWDAVEHPEGESGAPEGAGDEAHERLRAIEADIRAAVPPGEASVPARDIIASLQEAADRLRAAAEDELARIEDEPDAETPTDAADTAEDAADATPPVDEAPPEEAPDRPTVEIEPPPTQTQTPRVETTPGLLSAVAVPLPPRAVDYGAAEKPWLRTAIERLAVSDPARAADLFVALLPAQAASGVQVSYVLTAPTLGAVKVKVLPGTVAVERPPTSSLADARVAGALETLAPIVAGGGTWRPKGVRIEGAKRPVRKLLRRKRALGLPDVSLLDPKPSADVLLAALAAAVDPAWTAGHAFGVAYAIEGEGRWTVVVDDGKPLTVVADAPHAALISLTPEDLLPVLQGAPASATVAGGQRAVGVLHAWFDRARGVTVG